MNDKVAQPLIRALAPLLGFGAMAVDSEHVKDLETQAQEMNELAREVEARKMRAVIESLRPVRAEILKEGHVVADRVGRSMARSFSEGMEKEALVSGLLRGMGGLLGGVGRGVGALPGRAAGAIGSGAQAVRAGAVNTIGRTANAGQQIEGALTRAGKGIERRLGGTALPKPAQRIQGELAKHTPVSGGALAPGSLAPPSAEALARAPAAAVKPAPSPPLKSGLPTPPTPPPTPPTQAAPKAAGGAAAAGGSKPLIGLGTKAKLMSGAGVLGAGYLGYKGLQTARDYMMVPTASSQHWGHAMPLPMSVSPYGYSQQ